MRERRFKTTLTAQDMLDVTLHIEKGRVLRFALNYRALIDGRWHTVYRVDNFHGAVHEHRFWRGPAIIPLEISRDMRLQDVAKEYTDKITERFQKFRRYYEMRP